MSSANRIRVRGYRGLRSRCGSMRLFVWAALAIAFTLAGPLAVHGQSPDDIVRVETSLVQLNVGVADQAGKAITNLERDDFTVYEDGVPQSVLSFESTTTPFSLTLLLDMSGSTLSFRQNLKLAAGRFVDTLAPDDRVAVIAFNERTKLLTNFTADREEDCLGDRPG